MKKKELAAGKHDFPMTLVQCGICPRNLHDEVRGIDDWIERVAELAQSDGAKKYRKITSNDFKGDAFEHLVQCVIEYLGHDETIDCVDVNATEKNKIGIDLVGQTNDGKPHLHQCKFIGSPTSTIRWNVVSDFVGACPKHDEGSGYKMTFWTTCKGVSPQARDAAPSLTVFGIDWLGDTLGSNEEFWDFIYGKSLNATPKPRVGRISKEHEDTVVPHDYQQAALDKFIEKVEKEKTFKGRYIYPTGAGKTLIESLILDRQIDRNSKRVHLVVAPRIALLIQLMREYREFIGDKYIPIGLHSGSEEPEADDIDWMRRTQRNTTDECVVKREIANAKLRGKSAVVFSTYHSLHKLTRNIEEFTFDTMIADESQYCVAENYFEQIQNIRAKIKLYFTATERHYVMKDGSKAKKSNDNEEVFGKVISSETVKKLVKRKILVEPILHLMLGAPKADETNQDTIRDTLVAEAQHIANAQRELVDNRLNSKTLFACRKAENVEIIVDSKNDNKNLKKLHRKVPGHTIFTIISKKPFGAMVDGESVTRKSFLDRLKNCDGNALIFHYNILSEGIDIDGITGVAILRRMGDAKMMQTIGRCLRPFKKNPRLKPYSYVSVPIIEDDIHKNENLEEIVRKILDSGLEINAEKIVITDMKKDAMAINDSGKKKKGKQKNTKSEQAELKIFKHKLKTIIKMHSDKMDEDYHLGMLNRTFTDDVMKGIFDGKYPSDKYSPSSYVAPKRLDDCLGSYLDQYFVVGKAWSEGRMIESDKMRPITPLSIIRNHVDRLGDITGKLTLTYNVEYIPYLMKKGANVVLATRKECEATKNLAESQVIGVEYLTEGEVMKKGLKFNIVIGNPPYQERKPGHQKTQAIWDEFVEHAHSILKEGGKLAMIHPAGWRNSGGDFQRTLALLQSMDMEWLSIHNLKAGQANFNIGYRYDMYVAIKDNTPGFLTNIVGEDGSEYRECIKDLNFIMNFQSDLFKKMLAQNEDDRVHFIYSSAKYESRKEWMHKTTNEKKGKYIHPCVYNISKKDGTFTYRYSRTKENLMDKDDGKPHFGVPKVIFGVGQQPGIPMVDEKGEYGMCQYAGGIHDKRKNLPLIAKAMHSQRFRDVMNAVHYNTQMWNRFFIEMFRKDFWKEFVDENGNLIDERGNVIPEDKDGGK